MKPTKPFFAALLLLASCTKYRDRPVYHETGPAIRRHYEAMIPTDNAVINVGALNASDSVDVYLAHDGINAPGDPNSWVKLGSLNDAAPGQHWCYIDYAQGKVHFMSTPALGHKYKIIVTVVGLAPAYKSLLEGRY